MSASTATPAEKAIHLRRGISYTRSYTYTQRDPNGAIMPLVAADYTAKLVIRKRLDSTGALLTMTSPAGGLTVADVSGSLRVTMFVASTVTTPLDIGVGYKYTLVLTPVASPTAIIELVSADADVTDTAI